MPVNVNGLQAVETVRVHYRVHAEAGDAPEALLKPDWWKHVAKKLRLLDRVEVIGYDNRWFAEVIVLQVGKDGVGGARVGYVLGPVDLSKVDMTSAPIPEYVVLWGGPSAMWRIVRKADNYVVKGGFATKEAGQAWLDQNKVAA